MRALSTCVCIVMLTASAGLRATSLPHACYQQLFGDSNEGTLRGFRHLCRLLLLTYHIGLFTALLLGQVRSPAASADQWPNAANVHKDVIGGKA